LHLSVRHSHHRERNRVGQITHHPFSNRFFALWPDAPTRQRIAEAAASLQRRSGVQGRWIKPHRYHMTLQFLGGCAAASDDPVHRFVRAADAVRVEPFEFVLDSVGSFAGAHIPCWLGCSAAPTALRRLVDALARSLREHDCRAVDGNAWVPHVTIARDADRRLQCAIEPVVVWRADEFVLVESVLHPQAAYRIIGRWALR
jgi:2'-5' RNA ligase